MSIKKTNAGGFTIWNQNLHTSSTFTKVVDGGVQKSVHIYMVNLFLNTAPKWLNQDINIFLKYMMLEYFVLLLYKKMISWP